MAKKKKRKTRVTKQQIAETRAARKVKANKKETSPGPWTEIDPTPLTVKAKLRLNKNFIGEAYGTYPRLEHAPTTKKGWYPIIFNLTSKSIKRDVEEHGLDKYVAACEKSLNLEENMKKYGMIVVLKVSVDHSLHEDRGHRFLSCYAKTNKKSISGFLAHRKDGYKILE
ncbi:hypothetical protein LCGC14_1364850 [marine sediment metagenome]|uniref:Uncharacterized protein n=1 Tax=marine sediment metagenome TaxID=412755 RepID=A0A0F9MM71_9ZZZZ